MNNIILKAYNIHKSYLIGGEKLHVLKGLGIEVSKGEILMVMGASGAGKSTLLHVLGGLDYPDEGEVIINDINLYEIGDDKICALRNERIGFIFQFYHLLPEFTALENVMLPATIYNRKRLRKGDIFNKANNLLKNVGLAQRVHHKPGELSGGEQQRVAIARALINDPELILCDEPTGNLDSENSKRLIDLLQRLNQENQQTFMIVSHDESISKVAHRVIKIEDGRLVN